MAQTFNNGDSNLSVRTKLNNNATELNDTTSALAGKATPADIETALDNSTIFFDEHTFEGAVYPVPGGGQPAVGTESNPIKVKNSGMTPIDSVISGNMNSVTSNAVYQAIQTLLGGYTGTLQDLYNLISSGLITPVAPTSFIADDDANTGDWTNVSGYPNIEDYEYQINGGVITRATIKPFLVGNVNAAIGDVKVRVKAVPGVSNVSAWLTNPTAYTTEGEGLLPDGFSFITIDAITWSESDPLVNADNIWTISEFNSGVRCHPNRGFNGVGSSVSVKYTANTKGMELNVNNGNGFFGDNALIIRFPLTGDVEVEKRDQAPVPFSPQPEIGQYIVIKYLEQISENDSEVRVSIVDEDNIEITGTDYLLPYARLLEIQFQFNLFDENTEVAYPQGKDLRTIII